eukprot:3405009-Prymnesium_polylepis.2
MTASHRSVCWEILVLSTAGAQGRAWGGELSGSEGSASIRDAHRARAPAHAGRRRRVAARARRRVVCSPAP